MEEMPTPTESGPAQPSGKTAAAIAQAKPSAAETSGPGMAHLLDVLADRVPQPRILGDENAPFQMLVSQVSGGALAVGTGSGMLVATCAADRRECARLHSLPPLLPLILLVPSLS